jgi:tripartite-type tricarboxylate transporter receptor subunit TctC
MLRQVRGANMRRREFIKFSAAAAGSYALSADRLRAQPGYPERPIRLVIPFPPGGVYDALGRPFAERLKPLLGTIIVENMGGAGGSLGAAAVARARADGYTILLGGSGALVVAPIAATSKPYDPIRDLDPIYHLASVGTCFAVTPSLPVQSLRDLVAYAKTNPGRLSYATSGAGSWNHLTGEMFKLQAGLPDVIHVPYRGAGPALTDVVSGQVPLALVNVTGSVLQFHRSGKLRVIAVTTSKRLVSGPEIPTVGEAGFPGIVSLVFAGLFAPKGTPTSIIDRLAQAGRAAVAQPELQKLFIESGFEANLESGPDDMRKLLADEISRWAPIIKSAGLKLD